GGCSSPYGIVAILSPSENCICDSASLFARTTTDLSIEKSALTGTYDPGDLTTFQVVVNNLGPSDVTQATVTDVAPFGTTISSWSATFNDGASGNSSGTGNISELVDIPVNGSIVYTVVVSVPSTYTGILMNRATVATPPEIQDSNPLNNTDTAFKTHIIELCRIDHPYLYEIPLPPGASNFMWSSTSTLPILSYASNPNKQYINFRDCNIGEVYDINIFYTLNGVDTFNLLQFRMLGCDFGDAPNTYSTLYADDGPYHVIEPYPDCTYYMGNICPDADLNGMPSSDAGFSGTSGDDGTDDADEDGVSAPTLVPGCSVDFTIKVNGPGYLYGWIDWNGDGVFDNSPSSAEKLHSGSLGISDGSTLDLDDAIGSIKLTTNVPDLPLGTKVFARFRYSNLNSGVTPTGYGGYGEVEDHQYTIHRLNSHIAQLSACPNSGNDAIFNLRDADIQVDPENLYEVSYYESYTQAHAGIDSIVNSSYYVSPTKTIWSRKSSSLSCYTVDIVHLVVLSTPQLNISTSSVSCYNGNDGTATVNATGGVAPYTYQWSASAGGHITATVSGLAEGTYEVTVTDANLCTQNAEVTITQPAAALAIEATSENPTCHDYNDGSIDVTVTGGTQPYYFVWSNGMETHDLVGVPAGTYSVTVTDAKGCTVNGGDYTLTNPTEVTLTASNITPTDCNSANGSVTLTSSNGSDQVTLNGITQNSGSTFTGLQAGYYTAYTVGDCPVSVSFTIHNNNSNLAATVTTADVSCNGNNDGSATIIVSGGTTPYSMKVNTADPITIGANHTLNNLAPNNYNILITDAHGCTFHLAFDIDEPDPLVADFVCPSCVEHVACYGGATGSATVYVTGGVSPYTYSWSHNNDLDNRTATGLAAGTYYVTVTDDNNCTQIDSAIITQPTAALAITSAIPANPTCHDYENGSITITVNGGTTPYTYVWSNGMATQDLSGVPAGDYTVTVTDANGCTDSKTYTLDNPDAFTLTVDNITNTECNGAHGSVTLRSSNDDQIRLGSVIKDSPATFSGLQAGYYTAYTEGLCPVSVSFNINNINSTLTATVTTNDVSCNGNNDGEATITVTGGEAPYSVKINAETPFNITGTPPDTTITDLAPNNYNILITDAHGCTFHLAFDIDQPTPLVAEIIDTTHVSCHGGNNGTATVNATGGVGPYTYKWSNDQETVTATGLAATDYRVTVTDANGCQKTATVTIKQPAAILTITDATPQNPSCHNYEDGSVTITVEGGTAPYTYVWSNGMATEDISGLSAGTYTVTVTDANGCTVDGDYTLNNPTEVTLTASDIVHTECNEAHGSVMLTASPSSVNITLNDSTKSSGSTFYNLPAGYYTAYAASGCPASVSFNINNINSTLTATVTTNDVLCNGNNDGEATITVTGGEAPYSVKINAETPFNITGTPPDTTITDLAPNNYNILITDDHGCTFHLAFDIDQPTPLVAEIIDTTHVSCHGGNNGTATVNATGGVGPYTYKWSNDQETVTATGLAAGSYSVTVTDANGCQKDATVTIGTAPYQTPTLVCPDNFLAYTVADACTWRSSAGQFDPVLIIDHCDLHTLSYTLTDATTASDTGKIPETTFNLGVTTATYTLTYGSNSVSCSFTITVEDNVAPVITCPAPITAVTTLGACDSTMIINLTSVTDNCTHDANLNITYRVFNPDNSLTNWKPDSTAYEFEVGISLVEYRVIDEAGNVTTCIQQ
ncbi:MAG TPA: GEVED domain-containing protein, partial [Bacteroidales bacterium]|nr:GEVED domain-containing protein [Bacteroidales bacterium]